MAVDVARVHRIDPWLAGLLIRPMIADLAAQGTWRPDTARRYVVQDDLCHAVYFSDRCSRVVFYQADHGQFDCHATPSPPPRPDQPTWFSSSPGHTDWFSLSTAAPPKGRFTPWRYMLRTAACLPMRIRSDAFREFAALGSAEELGLPGPLGPDSFLAWFEAVAAQARTVHELLSLGPSRYVRNGPLLWTVERNESEPAHKPRLMGVHYLADSNTP